MNTGIRIIARSLFVGALGMAVYSGAFDHQPPVEVSQGSTPKALDSYVAEMLQAQVSEHKGCVSVMDWTKGEIPSSMLVHTGKAPNANVVVSVPFTLTPKGVNVLAWCK